MPLKLIEARFVAAVEKALRRDDAPGTIGVVRSNHVKISCFYLWINF